MNLILLYFIEVISLKNKIGKKLTELLKLFSSLKNRFFLRAIKKRKKLKLNLIMVIKNSIDKKRKYQGLKLK